jgi:hypothetical protein
LGLIDRVPKDFETISPHLFGLGDSGDWTPHHFRRRASAKSVAFAVGA